MALLLNRGEVRITDKEVWALHGGAEDDWTKLLEEGLDATDLLTEITRQMTICTATWLVGWAEQRCAGHPEEIVGVNPDQDRDQLDRALKSWLIA